MRRALAVAALVLAPAAFGAAPAAHTFRIARVVDGDTVYLTNGAKIRLVQIDTPEVYFGVECWGHQASAETKKLLPVGTAVRLASEPATDSVDRYGRLLRYVFRVHDGLNVNVFLVAHGDAALAVAAGGFGDGRTPETEAWVDPGGNTRPAAGLFVAQVVGESMNRRIPNGAFCVWRAPVEGSRTGRVVLVESREISDAETGGSYTVKLYERVSDDLVRLVPDSDRKEFDPIELHGDGEVRIVAELVEVLPGSGVEI
jgi:endonuclease YncB( thermonuclease family)